MGRIELPTSPLPRECSTTEPHEPYPALTLTSKLDGAGDEVRTRDILLGRQVLYQLSYSRKSNTKHTTAIHLVERVGFEPT